MVEELVTGSIEVEGGGVVEELVKVEEVVEGGGVPGELVNEGVEGLG